jgi:anti-anti-sigma factor
MPLIIRQIGKYKILDFSEPMRKYEDVNTTKETLDRLIEQGEVFLALNVSHVDFMHSYFIKILTATYKRIKPLKGDLCLIGPNAFIRNLIKILNFEEYVGLYSSEKTFRAFLNLPAAGECN